MTIPSVSITKADGQTGVVRPSDVGVLAIIAASASGTPNEAAAYLRPDIALADFGGGPLVECAAYALPVTQKPVVLVKGAASTAAAYGSITHTGTGAVASAGAATPADTYDVLLTIVAGATVGVAGATYTYSLDGGLTTSAVKALGTANSILIPDANVEIALAPGTLVAGDTYAFSTTGAATTNTDLVDALEALRVTSTPFECVLVDGAADATTVETLDTWIKALALTGRFKIAVCTARRRGPAETETEYKTALQGIFAAATSVDVAVCADVGDVASPLPGRATSGITQARPVGWALAARLMRIPVGRDAAYVNDGPVSQFSIVDTRGIPKYHDEYKHPGLEDLRLTTLRSFDGKQGSFITDPVLLSPSGSDYVFVQHARVINRACEIGYEILTGQLSRGVRKHPKPGPNGERYIAEGDALMIEGVANNAIRAELAGEVDDIAFVVSRTDDISSNQGSTVHATIQSVSLSYIKHFAVTAGFVKSIATQ